MATQRLIKHGWLPFSFLFFFLFSSSPCINLQLNGKGLCIGIGNVAFLSVYLSLSFSLFLSFSMGQQRSRVQGWFQHGDWGVVVYKNIKGLALWFLRGRVKNNNALHPTTLQKTLKVATRFNVPLENPWRRPVQCNSAIYGCNY